MNLSTVLPFVVGIAGSSVLTQAVLAWVQRRKVKADAADVLTDSALSQLASMRAELGEAKTEVSSMREEQRVFRRVLHEHEKWDRMVIAKLEGVGITVDTAPELWL